MARLLYVATHWPHVSSAAGMEIRIFGPLEVLAAGREVPLGGSKQRALLVLLVLHANETLTSDRMIDELWGERPPATAGKTAQVYVSRLRKALAAGSGDGAIGDGPIVTRERGYELQLDLERLDSHCFERIVAEGRREMTAGRVARAAALFEEALSLWRGSPLADLADEPFAQREIARLEDLRVAALEQLIEARLELGRHDEVVPQLETLIVEHPYRERLRAQLMLALYRSDRQADALQAYQDARRALVEELGIEPSERLRALERGILAHDPALAVPAHEKAELPSATASRLPAPPTRTIGRDGDLDAVVELLGRAELRLVTLVGPGGVGKTRLALEVARELEPELRDGAWFVSHAATAGATHVPGTIAQAIGVAQLRGESSEAAVERFLAARAGLLVLDNFEHVLAAAAWVSGLLGACPGMKVLATSREALRLQGEYRFEVPPLHVPAERRLAVVEQSAAATLFVERARSHDQAFELNSANAGVIAELCGRLDGLPLALELAAARAPILGPEELNARLAESLDLLSGGPRDAPDRQRTLRATIEWSHRLLDAAEADAFAHFAVFAGGATIEAAEQVTGADLDTLSGLVDKHLLLRRPGPREASRLLMLETVREYASEQLEAREDAAGVHLRHCRHFDALAERADPELYTHGQQQWLARIDAELDNFRAALDWSLAHAPLEALRLVGHLVGSWSARNRSREGLERVEAALEAAGEDAPIGDLARVRLGQAFLTADTGSLNDLEGSVKRARDDARKALSLFRQLGDAEGVGWALVALAWFEQSESFPQRKRLALADDALACARDSGDDRLMAMALAERALALPPTQAGDDIERAATALRDLGDSWNLLTLYWDAAHNAIRVGSPEDAGPWLDRALPIAQALEDPSDLMYEPGAIGLHALFVDDIDRAQNAFEAHLRLCRKHTVPHHAPWALAGLAAIAVRREDHERAAHLLGAATAIGPIDHADVVAQLNDCFFTTARARHGEHRWDKARAAGAELRFEQAIALALSPHARARVDVARD